MDSDWITVEVLINRVLFKPTLINTGYEYYSIVDKNFITELRLPRVKIPPKPITGFVKENTKDPGVEITEIAKFSIDIVTRYLQRSPAGSRAESGYREARTRPRSG